MQTQLLHIDNVADADVIWLIFGLYLVYSIFTLVFLINTRKLHVANIFGCCYVVVVDVDIVASATTECFQFN